MFNLSHELAMRKITNQFYHSHQHSNSTTSLNKPQSTTGFFRQHISNSSWGTSVDHIQEETQITTSPRRKMFLWNRSASKDG